MQVQLREAEAPPVVAVPLGDVPVLRHREAPRPHLLHAAPHLAGEGEEEVVGVGEGPEPPRAAGLRRADHGEEGPVQEDVVPRDNEVLIRGLLSSHVVGHRVERPNHPLVHIVMDDCPRSASDTLNTVPPHQAAQSIQFDSRLLEGAALLLIFYSAWRVRQEHVYLHAQVPLDWPHNHVQVIADESFLHLKRASRAATVRLPARKEHLGAEGLAGQDQGHAASQEARGGQAVVLAPLDPVQLELLGVELRGRSLLQGLQHLPLSIDDHAGLCGISQALLGVCGHPQRKGWAAADEVQPRPEGGPHRPKSPVRYREGGGGEW
mmetsp:Transcript_8874/g.24863  ORF Transcript_8874/g.24863 Transcript_8874/m.24863 type:complete len:321 (-) Transcript_8874:11-973(-)